MRISGFQHCFDRLAEIDRFARRHRAVVQILAGAKAAPGAGQHDDARVAEVGERVAQLLVHRAVKLFSRSGRLSVIRAIGPAASQA